jgi:anti-sigma-K factor RskA
MTPEETSERAALQGLGVLDGDERAAFERTSRDSLAARSETEVFARVAERLGLATTPVAPAPPVRDRILSATRPPRVVAKSSRAMTALAVAAAFLFAVGFVVMRAERDDARRAAEASRAEAERARREVLRAQAAVLAVREDLARETAFRTLVSHPSSRLVDLGPLPPAPGARARVLFDRASHEAVLIASGLDPAPAGKGYAVWVIGKGAPVPAGVFQVDASGHAVHRLPPVADVEWARTFAVTLEPAAGVPAPTGPMVLAGAVS